MCLKLGLQLGATAHTSNPTTWELEVESRIKGCPWLQSVVEANVCNMTPAPMTQKTQQPKNPTYPPSNPPQAKAELVAAEKQDRIFIVFTEGT